MAVSLSSGMLLAVWKSNEKRVCRADSSNLCPTVLSKTGNLPGGSSATESTLLHAEIQLNTSDSSFLDNLQMAE